MVDSFGVEKRKIIKIMLQQTETIAWRCSIKKVFLEILQNW